LEWSSSAFSRCVAAVADPLRRYLHWLAVLKAATVGLVADVLDVSRPCDDPSVLRWTFSRRLGRMAVGVLLILEEPFPKAPDPHLTDRYSQGVLYCRWRFLQSRAIVTCRIRRCDALVAIVLRTTFPPKPVFRPRESRSGRSTPIYTLPSGLVAMAASKNKGSEDSGPKGRPSCYSFSNLQNQKST